MILLEILGYVSICDMLMQVVCSDSRKEATALRLRTQCHLVLMFVFHVSLQILWPSKALSRTEMTPVEVLFRLFIVMNGTEADLREFREALVYVSARAGFW
jgi:hypothetical protein